ncbi:hypothetical protein ABPG74_016955 [Tetrahymena malaccensis]
MYLQSKTTNNIPGYTGHIPQDELHEDILQINQAKSHIPGYAGYIPGIRSENMYGKTYGKITYMSVTNQHHKGPDLPPDLRYTSTVKGEFTDQKGVKKQELIRQAVIEEAKITSTGYGSSPLRTKYIDPSEYKEKEIQPAPECNLTYQEACKYAYSN